ncbi:hypothetical protein ACFQU2_20985 [Siccirubricoccus deserti]
MRFDFAVVLRRGGLQPFEGMRRQYCCGSQLEGIGGGLGRQRIEATWPGQPGRSGTVSTGGCASTRPMKSPCGFSFPPKPAIHYLALAIQRRLGDATFLDPQHAENLNLMGVMP